MLAVALALAVAGWVAGTGTEIVSDIRELVPRDLPELEDVDELEDATGVSGELDVIVTRRDITDPEVIAWMATSSSACSSRAASAATFPSCRGRRALPRPALSDLFDRRARRADRASGSRACSTRVPPYFSQAVIARDAETGDAGDVANIAFGIRVMPLDEQKELIDDDPRADRPAGTESDPPTGSRPRSSACRCWPPTRTPSSPAAATGSPSPGLLAVALALLAVYRSARARSCR